MTTIGDRGRSYVEKPSQWAGLNACWVQRRAYVGSLIAQYAQCSKTARPGHLTCHWHKNHEEAAQRLARRGS